MTLVVKPLWQRLRYTRLRDVLRGRHIGQLDWRNTVAGAGLPLEVADTISLIVRRTRLWKSEQFDVALELVGHFQDGLETGLSGEELLATFGDPSNAARLIRRSKKRGRPWVWRAWWWASRSMFALLAAYGFTALLLAFDRPSISTDYLATLNRQTLSVPEEERAWPYYLHALEWLQSNTEAPPGHLHGLIENWLTGPMDGETRLLDDYPKLEKAQRKTVDTWLDERAEFLALLREAARHPRLGLEVGTYSSQYRQLFGMGPFDADMDEKKSAVESSIYFVMLPHIQVMRGLARALKADLQRSVSRGDGAAAMADLQAMIGITRHSDGLWLVCGLVKCDLLNATIESIETVLATDAEIWSTQELASIAHLLESVNLDVHNYIQGEKTSFYDLVQRLYSDDGNGDGYLTADGMRQFDREFLPSFFAGGSMQATHFADWQYLAATPATYFVAASRREIVAKHDEMWVRMQAEANRPLWDPLPHEETMNGQFEQMSPIERLRYGLLDRCLPAYLATGYTFEKTKGRLEGAFLGIGLELYRREHGQWPESLNQLAPRYIPTIPIDRYSGTPLSYRIVEGQPVIYSLGVDADDDGGVLPDICKGRYPLFRLSTKLTEEENGDWVIWSTRPCVGWNER